MRTFSTALVVLLLAVAGVACSTQPASNAPASVGSPGGSPTVPPPATPSPGSGPDRDLPERMVADVTGAGAFRHLEELQRIADAHGGNRAVGTPGYEASVDHVATVLREAGYEVTTPEFVVTDVVVDKQELTADGEPVPVLAMRSSPDTPPDGVTAPLAVADGAGCDAASLAAVAPGSVLLVRRGSCPFRQKSEAAGAVGAVGLLVANTEAGSLSGADLGAPGPGAVPTAGLTRAEGASLAARAGTLVTLVLDSTSTQTRSRNVIAQTRTGRPDEVVLAGGHLDSVPDGPGINDNGSGVAVLLETAQRLGGAPAVTNAVRFAFWGAEEVGLVGSTAYVNGLSDADRAGIALYLNFDMVASPNAAYLAYDGDDSERTGAAPGPPGSAAVERALVDALAAAGVPAGATDFDGRSDYRPFIAAGIPAGGLFTGASEPKTGAEADRWGGQAGAPHDPCYHRACDRADTVDPVALDRNADAVAAVIARFALSTDELAAG